MPDRDDERVQAEREARLANAYFDTLVGMGKTERVAAELTVAWIIARVRRERDERPEWER